VEERPRGAAPESWWLFLLAEMAKDIPALMRAIEALRAQGLTEPVVVHTFIHR
jgi:sirohydrochlorin ferrochelatase